MRKIFKNGLLVDVFSGNVKKSDILVENEKIIEISEEIDENCLTFDLKNNFVLPSFVNVFCHSLFAFEKNYFSVPKGAFSLVKDLMIVKNFLAGAVLFEDLAFSNNFLLESLDSKTESELSWISDEVAKKQCKLFMKTGLTLQEMGTIDKLYGKPLVNVLEDFGFLDRQSIIVGGNCFEKDDLQTLSMYDCDFCLTVGEDGKFGRRVTNLKTFKNLNIGLGSGYSFEIDFFAFMRQLIISQRQLFESESVISEQDVLKIATINGAKILFKKENLVKEGDVANFIVIKNAFSLYNDVFKTLVWEKSKHDVLLSVLNGEIVQKNGEIVYKKDKNYDIILKTLSF